MARSVIKKANGKLKFLYRKSQFLTRFTRKRLVSSLIQCHFDYASAAWYNGLTQELKYKLQVTQNKLIRFVLGLDSRSHIGREQFTELGWLPVESRIYQIILTHVFKIHSSKAPLYMGEYFNPMRDVHQYSTRFRVKACHVGDGRDCSMVKLEDSGRYALPVVKGFGRKTFAYNGCCLWNSLPQSIRDARTISCFKSKLKKHLINSV